MRMTTKMRSMTLHLHRRVLWVFPALALAAFPVSAQSGGENPAMIKHRNDCRLAAQVLTTRTPRTKLVWAREYIQHCEEEGPAAIAQDWRLVSADTSEVLHLMRASTAINDRRIYEQARIVALDRSRADVVRVGAMHVLDKYANPYNGGWFWSVRPPADPNRRVVPATGSVLGVQAVDGPVPVTGSVREPVLQLFEQVAAARANEPRTVWYAAAALAKRMGSRQ